MRRTITAIFLAVSAALPVRAGVDIQSVTSPGGITAWLVEEPSIPFVALELRFRGGISLDEPDARGAVNLMTGLLEEGTGELDARAFKRAQEALATTLSFDSSRDSISVSARFLTESRDESIDLLRAALTAPTFPPDAIERVRAQVLSAIQSDSKDPNDIARDTLAPVIYGDHPYAYPENGTTDSVTGLTRDDLVRAHKNTLARDRVFVGVVGDITAEEVGPMLDELLGGLPETGAPMPPRADVDIPPGLSVVDFANPQSVAIFVQDGMSQKDPDYFAAILLNHILGGGSFESRLTKEVRVKRGLTYGIYSYLLSRDLADVYVGSVSSSNDRIAEAIDVIQDEWRKAAETGVSAEELNAAKTYITGAYPLRFDGNGPIANILVGMQLMDLPIDYIETRNDRVDAVTLEDVNRVAEELVDPQGLHFLVVGQPTGLTPTVGE